MVETGAANGMVTIGGIRTVNGLGGMAAGGVITGLPLSSLAISAFHGGGVGAGAHGLVDGAGAIPTTATAIMVMETLTATAMAMVTTVTAMATITVTVMTANTALLLGHEWLSYSADSPVLAIIAGQSMAFWGLKRGEQFGLTRRRTGT
jgi:hypothetical protein